MASVIDTVANLAKRRGLVFPSGEIYGGTRSAWDYGPLGVELKENIKRQWWKLDGHQPRRRRRPRLVGDPAARGWVASGHVEAFNDPLVECLTLPQALPCRTTCRRRTQEKQGPRKPDDRADADIRARTAAPSASGPSRATST